MYYVGAVFWWLMVAAAAILLLLGLVGAFVARDVVMPSGINGAGMWGPVLTSAVMALAALANGVIFGAPLMAVGAYLTRRSYTE